MTRAIESKFTHFAAQNGTRIERLAGKDYRVTTDDKGCAVVGPRVHREESAMGRRRWWPLRKRAGQEVPVAGQSAGTLERMLTREESIRVLGNGDPETVEEFRRMDVEFTRLNLTRFPRPPRSQVWAKRLRDPNWHAAYRETVWDVFGTITALAALAVFGKGVWWLLVL